MSDSFIEQLVKAKRDLTLRGYITHVNKNLPSDETALLELSELLETKSLKVFDKTFEEMVKNLNDVTDTLGNVGFHNAFFDFIHVAVNENKTNKVIEQLSCMLELTKLLHAFKDAELEEFIHELVCKRIDGTIED